MIDRFDALGADPSLISHPDAALGGLGGFLALVSPKAARMQTGLADRGVSRDFRDDVLRLDPAPYLTGTQLHDAMDGLAETIAAEESVTRGNAGRRLQTRQLIQNPTSGRYVGGFTLVEQPLFGNPQQRNNDPVDDEA